MGHRVVGAAHSPDQAIQMARLKRPDLLLVDINLGSGMDGIEMAHEITAEREVPVIFLTAYSDEATVKKAKSVRPYNYIIKPLEFGELQIAIELTLHKFNVERELRETKQLLTTALQCVGNVLIFIGRDGKITNINDAAENLFGWTKKEAIGKDWSEFLVLEDGPVLGSAPEFIEKVIHTEAMTRLPPFLVSKRNGVQTLVDGIAGGVNEQVPRAVLMLRELAEFNDPVESMPGSADSADQGLPHGDYSFVLLLISPDNIGEVNDELGRGAGDRVLGEITQQLNTSLRSTDLASRYAGAIFSANLPYTSLEDGHRIAETMLRHLSERTFLDGTVALNFSIGLAHCDPSEFQNSPLELFRRANWALNVARESGGQKVVICRPDLKIELVGNLDRQSGRFSRSVGRDYRNMLLLWNTMSIVGKAAGADEWSESLLDHLRKSFDLDKAALFIRENNQTSLQNGYGTNETVPQASLPPDHTRILQEMFLAPSEPDIRFLRDGASTVCFVPVKRYDRFGLLYLVSSPRNEIRDKDLLFIKTLADYFFLSLYNLPASTGVGESESAPANNGQALYESVQMENLMEHVRLVAPTNATVLISGESGTGKELLARTIHELSDRRDRPLIIVDCGTVDDSAIEGELFGHGAPSPSSGRLKEARGGTVFLDEIAELPLDTQAKLLRFIQDKQLPDVGADQYEVVDTRVIAASSKNLRLLVDQGRFGRDLYYRLNIFAIHSPPLRDRSGDILLLARHFLQRYAKQYGKHVTGFTPDAEMALQQYSWPGNVRELINVMMRSIVLCRDSQVSTIHLGLFPGVVDRGAAAVTPVAMELDSASNTTIQQPNSIEKNLSLELAGLVKECLDADALTPIGRWLEEDLILASISAYDGIAYRAAEALSIPETTIRRKLAKIRKNSRPDSQHESESWNRVQALLRQMIPIARTRGVPAIELANRLLVTQIRMATRSTAKGAVLVGVSIPTYRRMLRELS